MGWRWYRNKWMDDREYSDTIEGEWLMVLVLGLPIGSFGYLFYALFDSQKMAFIGGGIGLVSLIIFHRLWSDLIFNIILPALTWISAIAFLVFVGYIIVHIFSSLPN